LFQTISDFELPSHHSSIQWDSVESLLVKMAKSLGMHGEEGGKKCQRMIYREQIDYRRDITGLLLELP
jgi:hypothetical protein